MPPVARETSVLRDALSHVLVPRGGIRRLSYLRIDAFGDKDTNKNQRTGKTFRFFRIQYKR